MFVLKNVAGRHEPNDPKVKKYFRKQNSTNLMKIQKSRFQNLNADKRYAVKSLVIHLDFEHRHKYGTYVG